MTHPNNHVSPQNAHLMTQQNLPSQEQLQNATRKSFREILQLGFSADDARQGKKDDRNALFFHSNGDKSKNQGRDQWLFTTESSKQAETIARALSQNPTPDLTPRQALMGLSFHDGKDRLDIQKIEDNSYTVRRTEDHPFLEGKKSLRFENWNAEDLHAAIDTRLLTQMETYAYTSRQFPYEMQEMSLRGNGLIDIQRTDTGSLLTFDRPVSRTALHLDSLSPTPETEAKIQRLQETGTKAQQANGQFAAEPQQPDQQEKLSPILKQYLDLKAKHPDALLLFRVGDFYETYLQDAQKASSILGITLTRSNSRKGPDGKALEMAGFPHHALDSYLPKLIRAGQRVAICDQLPDPKLTRNQSHQKEESTAPKPSQADATNHQTPDSHHADTTDIVSKLDEFIGSNRGFGIAPEQPIMATTAKGIAFEVNRVIREKDGSIRLYGNDDQGKERSVNILKANDRTIASLLSHIINNPPKELDSPALTGKDKPARQEEKQTSPSTKEASLGSEARKILTLSKIHAEAKKDHPTEMVFIRMRDYGTKKFMYQTFGQDAERLSQKVSPSTEVMRPEIKGKQRPVASLYQENLSAVKADMMLHGIHPIIINAKGERIGNDHFLAFSPEDRQTFLAQQQAAQNAQTAQSIRPQQSKGEAITSPIAPADLPSAGQRDGNLQSPAATEQKASQTAQDGRTQQPKGKEIPSPSAETREPAQVSTKTTGSKKNTQLTLDFPVDASIQYDVHKNSHVAGMFDIRLYINGEKAGAHRLSKEDRDRWFAHQFPITDLMMKYFPKELANVNLDNLTLYKAEQKQETTQQQAPSAETKDAASAKVSKTEKEVLYEERAAHHNTLSEQLRQEGKDAVVLLQMHSKDGKEFYQTFNKDAEFVADLVGRKTILSGDNRYVSLTSQEVDTLRQKLGEKAFKVENFDHINTSQQTAQQYGQTARPHVAEVSPRQDSGTRKPLPTITDKSRIEYVISPILRFNRNTQQQERVPGMFALSIYTEGQLLGHKTLNRNERDLLNNKPGEITNIINAKFANELQGTKLDFKQVHRPAVPEELWNDLSLPNGMTLTAMPRMTRNESTGKYELTAKVEGMTLGPKPMFRQDVNDFFDHARPAAEIVARVFREELRLQNLQDAGQMTSARQSADDVISLWQSARQDKDAETIAFIQREGKFGMFYQTFNDDAKNTAKVTNRSLRVIDTESQQNVVYANVPQEQFPEVTRQLRMAGFQPIAVNSEGMPVSIGAEQKVATPKTVSLGDGRRLEDINLRNDNGRWMMSANIDGKPLPEREVTREDATTFKQGQQTMADIVLKYYAEDLSHPQPSQTVKHSLGR